jgi:flavin-dependent dehydrogenase
MAHLGDYAIVIGGSIAGLTAARVLTDYFSRVTILERDLIEDRPVIHKSVPQGNRLHALLQGGQRFCRRSILGYRGAGGTRRRA